MSAPAGPFLVIGIGNTLLRDEGVGVHLLRALEQRVARGEVALPPETRLIDGGTLGLDLLPLLAGARALLFLDAVDLGLAPGAVTTLQADALQARVAGARAVLPAGIDDLLATARLADVLPAATGLVGVQPAEIAAGLELTGVVRAALPSAIAATIAELRRLDADGAAPGSQSSEMEHQLARSAA
jgi:hydrogenase maturation protease